MIELAFTIPPELWLTSNRHEINRGYRARIIRDLHQLAAATAMTAGLKPITGVVAAHWTVRYPKGVRFDKGEASNAQPTTKALLDGLVPRWLPDDGPTWIRGETFQRGPNLSIQRMHEVCLLLIDQEVPF